ncbi:helix-turn-helix domain-containing protein [Rhodococcus sp. WAY2]|uniref:helix-turn-helix domain-containing protein n=1 Tax=Rhodococcus sp. WAY2 TaxID=2663121 RepID=UPI0013201455|nr:helix-turn-helix transcriptional regulator [Rhodococcus sp. WAY2]QHE72939.1 putative involvement in replication/partition [Rhodococcus sp. WAY2]
MPVRPPLNGFQPHALELARTAAGMSRTTLARALGVDPSTIHNWETSRSHPEPEHLARITEELGISLDRLVVVPRNRRVLADLRILAGLTQRQVAYRAGVSTTTIGKIERGEASLSDRHAAALADALGLDERTIRAAYLRNRPLPQSP